MGGVAAALAFPRLAEGSVARAVTLSELVYRSRHVLVGTSVDAFCTWERIGSRSRIVTYSSVRVERPLDGRPPANREIVIRTLGGSIGDRGQIVHGEAVVALGERAAVFLHEIAPDVFAVTAMAQGHYPVEVGVGGVERLRSATGDLELLNTANAAVLRLHGRTLSEVEGFLSEELAHGAR